MAFNAPEPSQQTESLLRRLAGPSTGKAGLALDQTQINQIIAEVSKGSKFYENEKKKDKDLTERINKLLRHKEEALRGVDIDKIEASVDQLIEQLEGHRDLSQMIVHVDMDAFYANVELLHNPDLKDKPFGVGRGVLTTASYEARKYGVRSGMAGFVAKKLCPDLIFVPNHFELYSEMSTKVMDIFRRYDDTMCPAGSDEAYLNITDYCERHGMAMEDCVSNIRQAVFEETGLTVSAGMAPNKMLAKICSDKNKPNGQFRLDFDSNSIKTFMHDLSIRKVPGIGRVNERLLESIGIKTCGDIYAHRGLISLMDKQFGLKFLLRTYLGIASNIIQPYAREERKSIGAERTFSPLDDAQRLLQKLGEIAAELEKDMRQEGWVGKTVTLKYKLDTYQVFTRARSFDRWISKREDLFGTGKELLSPEFPLKLRLLGLRVTKLKDLRASDVSNGIKRFFEPLHNESARKRQKLEDEKQDDDGSDSDENEDSMPGFHEHDYETAQVLESDSEPLEAEDAILQVNVLLDTPSGKPGSSKLTSSTKMKIKARQRSTSITEVIQPTMPLECPICGKILQTDNQGLNTHVDFCLSRGAIWDAQGETFAGSSSKGRGVQRKGKRAK